MNKHSRFFSWCNLDHPGLEAVKAAVAIGRWEAAAESLRSYYRSRDNVRYYAGWETRKLNPKFDATKADQICRHRLVGQDLGKKIDWQANPHGDPEWKYCLHRHEYLTELGRAYWYTGDEKYTRAFKRILSDWIRENPMPSLEWMLQVPSETSRMHFMKMGNWRPLTLGIRLYTSFVPCFYHFLSSPEFTPEFLITMLTSMVEHARHLRLYYTRHKSYFNVSPNWGLMEANGLAHMGILFPEFREAMDWQVEAVSRLEEQARMQVLADGMQVERASGYHLVCTFCLLQILDLAQRNGVRVSETYRRVVESMADFVLSVMKPHGVYPMLKDGDESDVFGARASYGLWEDINNLNMLEDANDLRWVLKTAARIFKRPDLLYVATHGKAGAKPTLGSVARPEGGFFVMRTGWEHDDLYAVFTCGELGVQDQNCVHGHADALSLDVSGHGETLLIDPGRYLYEGPYRIWFKSTIAHNTVAVDGQDSSELADEWMFKTKANSRLNCWATTSRCDYVDGQHDGYQRLADPVTHRRRVLFVKPHFWLVLDEFAAEARHTYDQYFHFAAAAELASLNELAFAGRYPNGAGIVVRPLLTEALQAATFHGNTEPIQGWVSYDYAVKVAAPVVKYTRKNNRTTRLATLLVPFKQELPPYSAEALASNVFRIADAEGSWLVMFADGAETKFADFFFDGEVLCARLDGRGSLLEWFGARTSMISFQGRKVLDSVRRLKVDVAQKNS